MITGILPANLTANSSIEIKQTNHSFVYYKGSTNDISASELTEAVVASTNAANIYIPTTNESGAYKWKKYDSGSPIDDSATSGFGVLLWSEANPQTAKLEITPNGGTKYTVIVDWSGVTINAAAEDPDEG